MPSSRPVLLTLGALAAVLAVPALACAYAPLPAEGVAVDDLLSDVAVAAGPQRQVAALANVQNNRPASVLGAQRPSGGPAGPAQPLDSEPNTGFLNLAGLPDGTMLAAWSHNTVGEAGAFAAAPSGGLFAGTSSLLTAEARHDLATDASGRAVVVWNGLTAGANRVVRWATRAPGATTAFTPGGDLTPPAAVTYTPQVGAAPSGEAVAAWVRPVGGGAAVEASAGTTTTLPAAGPALDTVADAADVSDLTVAVGPGGRAVVAWTDGSGTGVVRAAFREPAGAFGAPVTLSGAGPAGSPATHVAADGVITLAWVEGGVVRVTTRAPGGTIGAAQAVSAAGAQEGFRRSPAIVADPGGAVFLSWLRSGGGTTALESSRRAAGGAFGAPATVATGVASFATAAEPGGNLAAAWIAPLGATEDALRLGGLDGDRPAVDATVPPTAGAGVPQTLSATATDWAGIAAYAWDMGDGTTLSGPSVSHVYAAPGPRVVTLRVTDRAGNVTTVTRTITVIGTSLADLDRRPPRATQVRLARTIARSTLVRRGIGVRLRADEASRATVELLGRARVATLHARGDVVLAQRAARLTAGRARAFVLKPPARLVSGGRGAFRATVRITLTDAAGNRATITRAVRVRTA